jgi:uncharacterized membrane protein YhaH (DUF805 family)
MSTAEKLFSVKGRLRRRDWWLWSIVLFALYSVLAFVGMKLLGSSSLPFSMGAHDDTFDQDRWDSQMFAVDAVVSLLLFWPVLAVWIKRRHDRGRSARLVVAFWLLFWAERGLAQAGRMASDGASGLLRLAAWLLLIAAFFIGVWLLISLGFLEGTPGPNRYGPSPKGLGGESLGDEAPEPALPSEALAD